MNNSKINIIFFIVVASVLFATNLHSQNLAPAVFGSPKYKDLKVFVKATLYENKEIGDQKRVFKQLDWNNANDLSNFKNPILRLEFDVNRSYENKILVGVKETNVLKLVKKLGRNNRAPVSSRLKIDLKIEVNDFLKELIKN